jgi:hypothetical protein
MTRLDEEKARVKMEADREEAEFWKDQAERERECEENERLFNKNVRPLLRKATPEDYRAWLEGWVEKEGQITHHYNYNMPGDFYVARSNFVLPPLYGSRSVDIIVPDGIEVTYEELGHNSLYYMRDFDHSGCSVPTYNDI